jgi:hypothetical protein
LSVTKDYIEPGVMPKALRQVIGSEIDVSHLRDAIADGLRKIRLVRATPTVTVRGKE